MATSMMRNGLTCVSTDNLSIEKQLIILTLDTHVLTWTRGLKDGACGCTLVTILCYFVSKVLMTKLVQSVNALRADQLIRG
jgi:hypothetical protein